jgi:site-specific DNA-methyltransferase (adenine-specific)
VFAKHSSEYHPQGIKPYNKIRNRHLLGDNYRTTTKNEYMGKYTNYPTTILNYQCVPQSIHPTQKPVELCEYLIRTYTQENNLVLDNCAGSGTTGIAAINTNRRYILIEKEQRYIDVINKRISEALQNNISIFKDSA